MNELFHSKASCPPPSKIIDALNAVNARTVQLGSVKPHTVDMSLSSKVTATENNVAIYDGPITNGYVQTISSGNSTSTVRSVPRTCEVCKGRGTRRVWEELASGKLARAGRETCEPCKGQGWLYITETETSYTPLPYTVNTPSPYVPYPTTSPFYGSTTAAPPPNSGITPSVGIN